MNIVIIDDEAVICSGLENIIKNAQNDWQVYEAYTDAEEALEFCDWDSVDLLLSDINMPNIDGLTLVDVLRDRGHDLQVIFISGYTEFKYAQKALQQKAIDYIIKPVSVKDLKHAIIKSEKLLIHKKKMQNDEHFIRNNIKSITKNFIYDMLFETRRLSKQEVEEGITFCKLSDTRLSLISFMLDNTEEANKAIHNLDKDDTDIFLYISKSGYNVIVICENKKGYSKIDYIMEWIKKNCSNIIIGETRFTENIFELSNINYEMMSQYKSGTVDYKIIGTRVNSLYSSQNKEEYSPHVISAIEYIKEHYSKRISLSSLAEELYVHPTYLSNLFKKQIGTNIVDFINNYRIEVAKDLLKDSRNKIYWVAERVGFANQRYFSQKFKKITGCTPVEYKQKAFFRYN